MQIASQNVYKKLASFETIEELNESLRAYKDIISDMKLRQDVKRNLVKVLTHIKEYSCSILGVSWKCKRKIAADTGLGYRTVIRICGRLESLGIIRQYAMKRASDMQQTSNAIVIIPPVHSKSGRQENEKVADQKNNISLKQKHNINHLNVKHSGYIKFVPKALQQFKAFFGLNIKDMYGRVWLAAKKLGVNADQASMQRVGFNVMESIKSFIKKSGTMISPDEQRAMAYVIAYEQIKQGVEKGSIYDMSYMYAFLEKVKKMRAMESRTKQEPF